MTGYHFTTVPLEHLDVYGLCPYPIIQEHQASVTKLLYQVKSEPTGIWIWPDYPTDEYIRQFLLWQVCSKSLFEGTLLEVNIEPKNMLGYQLVAQGFYPELSHTLTVNDRLLHELEFDICLWPILEYRPLKRARFNFQIEELWLAK